MTPDERLADEVLAAWETAQPSAVDVRLARAVKRLTAELAEVRALLDERRAGDDA